MTLPFPEGSYEFEVGQFLARCLTNRAAIEALLSRTAEWRQNRTRRPRAMAESRAFQHVGAPCYVDGIPFGHTMETGDCYVSSRAMRPGDVDLLAEIDALQAMVESCREIVAENKGDLDGDRPIDHIAAVVGYPEAAGVAAGPQATPDQPSRDEQIATVERWGWSRDVSHTAWLPPGEPTYSVRVFTSPLCVCTHEQRHHTTVTRVASAACSWMSCECLGFVGVAAEPNEVADRCHACGGTRSTGIGALVHREDCPWVAERASRADGRG